MGITSEHIEYTRMAGKWQRCNDVSAGTDAVHEGGERYLPRLQDQTDENYKKSLQRTILFNATWRTITGLVGMIFRKPPLVEVPTAIESMLDDVTMSGESLFMVAQDIAEESIKVGRVGILVDHPAGLDGTATMAAAQSAGMRPFIKIYKAADIYNWRIGRVNNKTMLTEVRLKESHEVPDGLWDVKYVNRYRILSLIDGAYTVRLFEIGDKGEEVLISETVPTMRGASLGYIPFQFISTDDITPDVDLPPLVDLVDMNLHHYRITSIKCNALPFAVPTMFIAGNLQLEDGEKVYVGSSKAIHSNDPAAHGEYIEYSGQGLGAVEKEIDKAEAQMAILGARMLEPQRGAVESAEGQSIHRKGEESILSTIAQTISIGLTNVMTWFADWAGASGEVNISLNRDFYPAGMTPQMLTALLAGWQSGAYSDQTLFDNLQQAEIIDAETTLEDEQGRIGTKSPALVAPEPAMSSTIESVDNSQAIADALAPVVVALTAIMEKISEPQAAPIINVAAPIVNIPEQQAPTINITQPDINIAPASVSIAPPAITINIPEQQPANVTVNNVEGKKTISIDRDSEGNLIGGTVQ